MDANEPEGERDLGAGGPSLPPTQIVVPEGGLVFVSPTGRVLMSLADTPTGCQLYLYNTQGQAVAQVGTSDAGGIVQASAPDGAAATLIVTGDGPIVGVHGADLHAVVMLHATEDGGIVTVSNRDRQAVATLAAQPDGGTVHVNNREGVQVGSMQTSGPDGSLLITDAQGGLLLAAPDMDAPAPKGTQGME